MRPEFDLPGDLLVMPFTNVLDLKRDQAAEAANALVLRLKVLRMLLHAVKQTVEATSDPLQVKFYNALQTCQDPFAWGHQEWSIIGEMSSSCSAPSSSSSSCASMVKTINAIQAGVHDSSFFKAVQSSAREEHPEVRALVSGCLDSWRMTSSSQAPEPAVESQDGVEEDSYVDVTAEMIPTLATESDSEKRRRLAISAAKEEMAFYLQALVFDLDQPSSKKGLVEALSGNTFLK
ncbi:unnamed protein product, partial [Symbiodinium sp. CCMP2592]